MSAVCDEAKEITRKKYHENLLNKKCAWNKNSLSETDRVSCIHRHDLIVDQ